MRVLPEPTALLRFREMTDADLDAIAGLLGDPEVMRHYPRPRTRAEAQAWIDRNRERYAEDGFGLWVIETHHGEFVGECGLTWQDVDGERLLEVGYHVVFAHQGRGLATEAARACVQLAVGRLGSTYVVAVIVPANLASQRVAAKLGMRREREAVVHGREAIVFRLDVPPRGLGRRRPDSADRFARGTPSGPV